MAVQASKGAELFRAEIAFIRCSVPGTVRGNSLDVVVARKGDHRAGDDVVAVELLDELVDLLAVET
jgi:hypothetical protein